MILKTAANMQEHGYIEAGTEGGYYEVDGQRTEIGGGGGSSDFSTAEVTIVNSSNVQTTFYFPYINHEFNDIEAFNIGSLGTSTYTVPLYMNRATMLFDEMPAGTNVNGDAEINEDVVIITGNCTITIS